MAEDAQGLLQRWGQSIIRDGVERDSYTDEYKSDPIRNAIGGILGGGSGTKAIEDREKGDKKKKSREAWANAGIHRGKLTEMGLSETSSVDAIAGGLSSIAEAKDERGHTRDKDIITAGQAPQLKGIEAGLEQGRLQHQATMQGMQNTNNLAIAGLAQSNNQFMAQMADSKDQRAMELQMRREEMDRLDRKDERNRRKDSIAALTAGLASLGAAFAL